jgi:predicted HTH transcriptional regulator
LLFDFENSIRRSRTENARYEFKQGILRLDAARSKDPEILNVIIETLCGIANVGPEADGFLYVGIADKIADAERSKQIYGSDYLAFEHTQILGIDREAAHLGVQIDQYLRIISDAIKQSQMGDPLKTNILANLDVLNYKGFSVVRIRVPRQSTPTFVGDELYLRMGATTIKAGGQQIAAVTRMFNQRPN